MTAKTDLTRRYQRAWFPSHLGLTEAQRAERAELMRLAALSMPRPKGLTASQHADRRNALASAAEPYRNRDLLRRVAASHRPAEFRARIDPYQVAIGRALDGVLARRTVSARAALSADLATTDRAESDRIRAALDRRVAAADRALTAALDRRAEAALERMPRPPRLTFWSRTNR